MDTLTQISIDPLAFEKLHPAMNAISSFSPFIVATLVAYVLGSQTGLRNWIALKAASAPEYDEKCSKRAVRTRAALHLVTILTTIWLCYNADIKLVSPYWIAILLPVLIGPIFKLLSTTTGLVKFSAHRTVRGRPWIHPVKGQKVAKAMLAISAIGVSVASLLYGITLGSWVGFTAITYIIARGRLCRNVRFGAILHIMLFMSIIVAFSERLGLVKLIIPSTSDGINSVEDKLNAYVSNWIIPSAVAAIPGVIFALVMRFDYEQHISQHPENDMSTQLETVTEQRRWWKKRFGDGVVVPRRGPRNFRASYYRSALVAWMLSQVLALAFKVACSETQPEDLVSLPPAIYYAVHFVPLGMRAVYLSILAHAWFRGELGVLFAYVEAWKTTPSPSPADEGKIRLETESQFVNEKTTLLEA